MTTQVVREGIALADAEIGDTLDTFQQGRITVAAIEMSGTNARVTTDTGRVWVAAKDQLVERITIREAGN